MDIVIKILITLALVAANAYFVAAEFAAVSARLTRLQTEASTSILSRLALIIKTRLDLYLSACQLGVTLASLGLARDRRKMARVADNFFMSPLVLPGITFGLAALVYFSTLGFRPSLDLMIAGHLIVTMPFILRTTTASLSQLDPALLDSSRSLGASWFYTSRRVTLPLIAPGIAVGAFLAFMASIDNVPVSLFLSNARTDTLPIRMWGMMEATLDVRVAAVSGVLIAAAFVLMLIMEWTVGLTRRMRD